MISQEKMLYQYNNQTSGITGSRERVEVKGAQPQSVMHTDITNFFRAKLK